jgi:integrase/recombinase XerD
MNRRLQGSLPLSKAITGFLQYKAAEGLSPNTLQSYQRDLKLGQIYVGDIPVHALTTKLIQDYFVWLRTDYQPRRLSGDRHPLAAKTIHNFYISLSAFFTWASREFGLTNPIKAVPPPKFQEAPIAPFTKEEVELLLKACEFSVEVQPSNRRKFISAAGPTSAIRPSFSHSWTPSIKPCGGPCGYISRRAKMDRSPTPRCSWASSTGR